MTTNDDFQNLLLSTLSKILTNDDFYLIKELYNTGNIIIKLWCLENLNQFTISEELENLLLTALKDERTTIRQKAVEVSQNFLKSKKYMMLLFTFHKMIPVIL